MLKGSHVHEAFLQVQRHEVPADGSLVGALAELELHAYLDLFPE